VASGGWPGLSGGHGRRGARRNRALPARDRARKGWARWVHGGIGSPPLRGHRQNFTTALRAAGMSPGGRRWPPEGGSASLEAMGVGVHDGIGALPDGVGLCPLATVPARAGNGGGTVELARRPCGGIVRILRRLSEPPGGKILTMPPHGRRANSTVPARAGNSGTGSPPVRGHRQNFTKALRGRREAAGGLRRVARPLWRPWAAWCTTE